MLLFHHISTKFLWIPVMLCFSLAKAVQDSDDLIELQDDHFNLAFQEAQQAEDVLAAGGIGERNPLLGSFDPIIESANDTSQVWWIFRFAEIDIQYATWLGWLFTPIAIAFLLPALIILFLYLTALFLFIYKWHRHDLVHAYERDFWEGARQTLAALWEAQAWIWHGYEIEGLENIPYNGPALIIYYHGAIPIDFYYLVAKCILYKGRLVRSVGDRFLFKIPGWSNMMEVFKVFPGTVHSCANILKEGNLLAIAPGGVYEAQFGNENYELIWKNRIGFAKVALDAKVPIIPMFTRNIREGFRTVQWGRWFWEWFYFKTRLPLAPVYGFFPVKLKTFIGKPIPYDPDLTPEELAQKTAQAIQRLVSEHQRVPGSVIRALIDRVYYAQPQKVG